MITLNPITGQCAVFYDNVTVVCRDISQAIEVLKRLKQFDEPIPWQGEPQEPKVSEESDSYF